MNILILTQYFHPESFPINGFADALANAGASVTVLTGQPNYPDGAVFPGYRALSVRHELFRDRIPIHRVPLAPRGQASGARLAANYLSFIVSALVVGPWLLRGRGFDVVLVYAPSPIVQAIPGIVIGRLKNAKVITWVQDLWPESLLSTGFVRNRVLLALVEAVVRFIYARNDLLLGQSRAFVSEIQPLAGSTPVQYFPNPGEAPAGSLPRGTTPVPLPAGFNVMFAGNFGSVQSLETILGAAERLKEEAGVHFILVGSGSRAEWVASEVRRRALRNVHLPGRFERHAMPALFAQADALLVTLKRGRTLSQTIPSKVQSYLGAGRPLLAALDGEGATLVRECGAGLTSPAEDAQGLAANVLALRAMTAAERERMGAAGRAYYDAHFRPDVLARRLIDTCTRLSERRAPLTAPASP